jgi:murein L,D-transpeptidase YcbB/YkuD
MKQVLKSRVVVGKEGRNSTPVFIAQLSAIDFSPYWNVPMSIARREILPRLRRDPGYLAQQEMEFVAADGRTVSTGVMSANLAAVERGAVRIRQRPGARNALGDVKFTMPNSMNIYLHDTPSRLLFSESRRDFSHGCIRVEEPLALAAWVLADDPSWDESAIRQAMEGDKLRIVRLATQIPVVVFYTTATVDEDGTLRFLPDIYGYDKKLDAVMPVAP